MKEQNSQQGSAPEVKENTTVAGVAAILRGRCGLKHLSIMLNIEYKLLDLGARKEITFNEFLLLRMILLSTVGAHNRSNQDRPEFNLILEDLAQAMNVRLNKIYGLLKSLEEKKMIIRGRKLAGRENGKTIEHIELLGLNPEIFGVLLTELQERKQPKKLSTISETKSQTGTNQVPKKDAASPTLGATESQTGTGQVPNQDQMGTQLPETNKEFPSQASSQAYIHASSQPEKQGHEPNGCPGRERDAGLERETYLKNLSEFESIKEQEFQNRHKAVNWQVMCRKAALRCEIKAYEDSVRNTG